MNRWKEKVSCLVPECLADHCDRERKKQCALRKYFLMEYRFKKKIKSMNKKKNRNEIINKQIRELHDSGYKVKDAIEIIAHKYYLSPQTVRDIWYK